MSGNNLLDFERFYNAYVALNRIEIINRSLYHKII
jgi:hypothetical protein